MHIEFSSVYKTKETKVYRKLCEDKPILPSIGE